MFEEILGQDRIKGILTGSILKNQVSHAYLFTGPRGIGKTYFARAFARALLCTAPAARRPCGMCDACIRLAEGTYPDFITVAPAEGTRSIKITQIRELIRQISAKTYDGNARVCLITHGEAMTVQAQNALLKSLEEPEPGNVFMITAENSEKILPTIRSRCQMLVLEPASPEDIGRLLALKGCDGSRWETIVAQSGGLPGRAMAMMTHQEDETIKNEVFETICAILNHNGFPIFHLAEGLGKEKDGGLTAAEDLILELTGVMEAFVLSGDDGIPEGNRWLRKVRPQVDPHWVSAATEIVFELTRRLGTNANPRMQWEAALFKILALQENNL